MAKPPSVKARRSFNKGARRGRGIAGLVGMLFGGVAGTIYGVYDGGCEIMGELFPSEDDDEEEEGEEDEAEPVRTKAAASSPGQLVTLPPQAAGCIQ